MKPALRVDGQSWARRWRAWLRSVGLADTAQDGLRVKRLEILPGRITASLPVRGGKGCEVEVRFTVWTDEEWQRVLDALGSQAIFAAQLLAGDLPPELESAIAGAGVSLLPENLDEVTQTCTCGEAQHGCDHLAAVYLALGDMLADDPWLLFRLRGRDQRSVLRGLRTQRTRHTAPVQTPQPNDRGAHAAAFYRTSSVHAATEAIPSLESQVAQFWGGAKTVESFRPHVAPPPVELALLRRLGAPALGIAGEDLYNRLAALYRHISEQALDVAFATDPDSAPENGDTA
jgi:uncharacterized Zn finger protein